MIVKKVSDNSFELSGVTIKENGTVLLSLADLEKLAEVHTTYDTVSSLRQYFQMATEFPAEVDEKTAQIFLNNPEILPQMADKCNLLMNDYGYPWLEAVYTTTKDLYNLVLEKELEKSQDVHCQIDAAKHAGWNVSANDDGWTLTKHSSNGVTVDIEAKKGSLYEDVEEFVDSFDAYGYATKGLVNGAEASPAAFTAMVIDSPELIKANQLLRGCILSAKRLGLPEE